MAQKKKTRKSSKQTVSQPNRALWFSLGMLVCAIALSYVYHTGYMIDGFGWLDKPASHGRAKLATKPIAKKKAPQFDFYTMLQDNKPVPSAKKPQPKTATPQATTPKQTFNLQAAATRNAKDADKLKVQLILAGHDVHVETFKKNQTIWYRVLVGPYPNKARATQAQQTLKAGHFDSFLVSS